MAFYDFMQKLVLAQQIRFNRGEISLLQQRVAVIPEEIIVSTTSLLNNDDKALAAFYENTRTSFSKEWAARVKQYYGFTPQKYMQWLIETANLSGWGINELSQFDSEKKTGILKITNAPAANFFKGKTKKPVEHICRALYAGGATAVFGEDIDFIETKCAALGNKICELTFGPRAYVLSDQFKAQRYQIQPIVVKRGK